MSRRPQRLLLHRLGRRDGVTCVRLGRPCFDNCTGSSFMILVHLGIGAAACRRSGNTVGRLIVFGSGARSLERYGVGVVALPPPPPQMAGASDEFVVRALFNPQYQNPERAVNKFLCCPRATPSLRHSVTPSSFPSHNPAYPARKRLESRRTPVYHIAAAKKKEALC